MAERESANEQGPIVLIDGVCNLCNGFVRFMLKHEREPVIRFASLQSTAAKALLDDLHMDVPELSTMVLIESGAAYMKSTAVLQAARHLRAPWRWLSILRVVPRPIRDWVYARVVANRYRIFGKSEACPIPTSDQEARFLDADQRRQGLA